MKICTVCNTSNHEDASVCSHCGSDITKKYIRRKSERRKHQKSRSTTKKRSTLRAKIFGYTLIIVFLLAILLVFLLHLL